MDCSSVSHVAVHRTIRFDKHDIIKDEREYLKIASAFDQAQVIHDSVSALIRRPVCRHAGMQLQARNGRSRDSPSNSTSGRSRTTT